MKIQIQNTLTKEVEITLPHYRKTSTSWYKVTDEKYVICIEEWLGELGIKKSEFYMGSAFSEITLEITAEEFESKLAEVKEKINAL